MSRRLKFEFVFNIGDETSYDNLSDFFAAMGNFTKEVQGKDPWAGIRVTTKKFKITIETIK